MKRFSIIITFLFIAIASIAQNESDALRYAFNVPTGTARFTAMGGAMGALGADLTTMSYNPAGIGVYRKSDAAFSISFSNASTKAGYNNNNRTANNKNLTISNLGFVVTYPSVNNSDWKFINFGFAYNQLANFGGQTIVEGINENSSRLDIETDNLNFDNAYFNENPFYITELVYYDSIKSNFTNDYIENQKIGSSQKYIQKSDGKLGEYTFNLSANYIDKLYIGVTIGIQQISYTQKSTYYETPLNNKMITKNFEYYDEFSTKGNGVNMKFGAIYKINNMIRLGAAIHTPTFFELTDVYTNTLKAVLSFDNVEQTNTSTLDESYYNWYYTSPFKAILSGAFVFGTFGTVSVDYEHINYNKMSLSSDDGYFETENQRISEFYKPANNVKIGGELRLGMISLRLGAGFFQSAYSTNQQNNNRHKLSFSGGLGIRSQNFYFDAAYQMATYSQNYALYNYNTSTTLINTNTGSFIATFGFKF